MKKEFKVQVISEKVDILEVNGQERGCMKDCKRWKWYANSSSKTRGCYQKEYYDALISVNG